MTDILYQNDIVTQIYRVTGRDKLHVHAVASSGDEMELFLHTVIDALPGVISCSCKGLALLLILPAHQTGNDLYHNRD